MCCATRRSAAAAAASLSLYELYREKSDGAPTEALEYARTRKESTESSAPGGWGPTPYVVPDGLDRVARTRAACNQDYLVVFAVGLDALAQGLLLFLRPLVYLRPIPVPGYMLLAAPSSSTHRHASRSSVGGSRQKRKKHSRGWFGLVTRALLCWSACGLLYQQHQPSNHNKFRLSTKLRCG